MECYTSTSSTTVASLEEHDAADRAAVQLLLLSIQNDGHSVHIVCHSFNKLPISDFGTAIWWCVKSLWRQAPIVKWSVTDKRKKMSIPLFANLLFSICLKLWPTFTDTVHADYWNYDVFELVHTMIFRSKSKYSGADQTNNDECCDTVVIQMTNHIRIKLRRRQSVEFFEIVRGICFLKIIIVAWLLCDCHGTCMRWSVRRELIHFIWVYSIWLLLRQQDVKKLSKEVQWCSCYRDGILVTIVWCYY